MDTHTLLFGMMLSIQCTFGSHLHGYLGHQTNIQDKHDQLRYHGPTAIPHVLHDGHIADTHEVAAAKAEHFAAVAKAQAHGGHGHDSNKHGNSYENRHDYHGHLRYHGPTALPHVLHDGHIADTHEVAAAKAEHFAAISKAHAHGGYGYGGYAQVQGHAYHAVPYHGPLAKPFVLHNGYLADTHEVAAAKHHHLQALHSSHSGHY